MHYQAITHLRASMAVYRRTLCTAAGAPSCVDTRRLEPPHVQTSFSNAGNKEDPNERSALLFV